MAGIAASDDRGSGAGDRGSNAWASAWARACRVSSATALLGWAAGYQVSCLRDLGAAASTSRPAQERRQPLETVRYDLMQEVHHRVPGDLEPTNGRGAFSIGDAVQAAPANPATERDYTRSVLVFLLPASRPSMKRISKDASERSWKRSRIRVKQGEFVVALRQERCLQHPVGHSPALSRESAPITSPSIPTSRRRSALANACREFAQRSSCETAIRAS